MLNEQIDGSHYGKSYDTIERFNSYFQQVDIICKLKPMSVLEIGVGNKTVSNYIRNQGIELVTCDLNRKLDPDYVADIRRLPFPNESFYCVMACEVLEHLPWDDFENILAELFRVSQKYVVISIPEGRDSFEFIFRSSMMGRFLKRTGLRLLFRVPGFLKKDLVCPDEHYWEMGLKGVTLSKVKQKLKKYFKVVHEKVPYLNPYHYFFVLQKEKDQDNSERV